MDHQIAKKNWFKYPLLVWSVQLIAALITVIIFTTVIHAVHGEYSYFWSWDGKWYTAIATHGYNQGIHTLNAETFFPLYPVLIHFTQVITRLPVEYAAMLVSNAALLVALMVLYRLIIEFLDEQIAKHSLWLLTVFPTALFFHCAYPQSLILLSLVLFFYCLQRQYWYRAMICGFFATLTHALGVLLIFAGLAYLWSKRKELGTTSLVIRGFSLVIIPLGLITFIIYLYLYTGHTLAYFTEKQYVVPVYVSLKYLLGFGSPHANPNLTFILILNEIMALVMLTLGLLMLTYYRHVLPLEQKVFYVVFLLVTLGLSRQEEVGSQFHYLVLLFPGFIIWALWCKKEFSFIVSIAGMLFLKVILLGMFANSYWIG